MTVKPYDTEPLTDFSISANQKAFQKGLKQVQSYLGKHYDLVIDGKRISTNQTLKSVNPSNHQETIGIISQASKEHAEVAIRSALKSFETWKKVDVDQRAQVLFDAASIIRKRKFEFAALLSLETGKPWAEADADVAEAIDFLEYYGRQAIALVENKDVVLSIKGVEKNTYHYIPLGVGAIITPWNFPLAILAGMTTAAIVTGNSVVLKPAVTTQVIAYKFLEVLEEAGVPPGVVNLVPGDAIEVGEYLVTHPKIRFISFTGSKAVGIHIYEKAAIVQKGQLWLKRVISEMGGKDAIVVDKDANLDVAADAITKAAFSFSGQKCSACSRAIVHQDVYDIVLDKVIKLTQSLKVGAASDFETFVGPVNDQKAFDKITSYIEIGKQEGKLVYGGGFDASKGYFIEPTIFADVQPNARIMKEEIFGPVLAFSRAKNFKEALEVANNTEYGLTGAVISNNPEHLEKAKQEFHIGNLYLNRKCTGAIVGYQPFGGFNMSGTDSKAGGPDYLIQFMQAKTISEFFIK